MPLLPTTAAAAAQSAGDDTAAAALAIGGDERGAAALAVVELCLSMSLFLKKTQTTASLSLLSVQTTEVC